MHSVKFNAVMNTILTVSNLLVTVITIPYTTRVLSVAGYGDVSFAQNMSQWLSALCLVGIPTYGIRECAKVKYSEEKLARVVCELLIIITICTFFVLSVFGISIFLVPRLTRISVLLFMFLFSTLILSYGVEWFYQAIEDYTYITVRNIVFKLISLAAILLFVREKNDYLVYGFILSFVICGNNLFNFIRLFKKINFLTVHNLDVLRHVKPLFAFSVLSIASSIYLSLDTVILGFMSPNNTQVAFYQLSSKIKNVCFQIIYALIGVMIPRLSFYIVHNKKKYSALLKNGFFIVLDLCLGLMFFLFIYSSDLVVVVSSEKYLAASYAIKIIGSVSLFSCISYFIGLCILTPTGEEKKLAIANLIGVPISVICNILFDGTFGATGAALSMFCAELIILTVQVFFVRKKVCEYISLGDVGKTFCSHCVAFLIMLFVRRLFISVINSSLLSLFAGLLSYIIIWFIIASLIREYGFIYISNFAKELTSKIKKKC